MRASKINGVTQNYNLRFISEKNQKNSEKSNGNVSFLGVSEGIFAYNKGYYHKYTDYYYGNSYAVHGATRDPEHAPEPIVGHHDYCNWVSEGYYAIPEGSTEFVFDESSPDKAIEGAIKQSKYYHDGYEIVQVRDNYVKKQSQYFKVYYASYGDKVSRKVLNDASIHYIVKDPDVTIPEYRRRFNFFG